jgi:hypothetical protein
MTPQEINAFARTAAFDAACSGHQVFIRTGDGGYLDQRGKPTPKWQDARVFDYDGDNVREQIQQVEILYGAKWTAEVPSEEQFLFWTEAY